MRMPVAQRRAALVDAALRVIARNGVHAASTRAITREAGMSLASFHYAFDSRDALLRVVIRSIVADERRVTERMITDGASLRDQIAAALHAYVRLLAANPRREQAMLELMLYAVRDDAMAELAAGQYRSYRTLATALARAAARSTGVRWTVPVDDVARLAVVVADGLTTTWLADRDDAATARAADAAADMLAALATTVPR